jgi:hypothetical protein
MLRKHVYGRGDRQIDFPRLWTGILEPLLKSFPGITIAIRRPRPWPDQNRDRDAIRVAPDREADFTSRLLSDRAHAERDTRHLRPQVCASDATLRPDSAGEVCTCGRLRAPAQGRSRSARHRHGAGLPRTHPEPSTPSWKTGAECGGAKPRSLSRFQQSATSRATKPQLPSSRPCSVSACGPSTPRSRQCPTLGSWAAGSAHQAAACPQASFQNSGADELVLTPPPAAIASKGFRRPAGL